MMEEMLYVTRKNGHVQLERRLCSLWGILVDWPAH